MDGEALSDAHVAKRQSDYCYRYSPPVPAPDSWGRSRAEIRRYCGELREVIEVGSAPPETKGWGEWAEAYADVINPLAHPPGMPDVPEPKHDDLRPFLQELGFGGYPYW